MRRPYFICRRIHDQSKEEVGWVDGVRDITVILCRHSEQQPIYVRPSNISWLKVVKVANKPRPKPMTDKIYVAETGRMGKGVFAAKDFEPEEPILYIEGEVVETDTLWECAEDVQDHWFPFDHNRYVFPQAPWTFLNHSCEPNAGIKNNRLIIAIRSIRKGDQVFIDYAMNSNDDWTMECHCCSDRCRKIVGNFDLLDDATKELYLDYVCDFIKQDYIKSRTR